MLALIQPRLYRVIQLTSDRKGGCPCGSRNFSRSEADCGITRSRMPPPDVWDRRGRSEAACTKVAWRRRSAWRTGQDFGSQSVRGSLHPVHLRGHLVGEMTPRPPHKQRRHPRTAPGRPTKSCPAQRTWPATTRPWGSSGLRIQGAVARDPTMMRCASAPHRTRQRDGDSGNGAGPC